MMSLWHFWQPTVVHFYTSIFLFICTVTNMIGWFVLPRSRSATRNRPRFHWMWPAYRIFLCSLRLAHKCSTKRRLQPFAALIYMCTPHTVTPGRWLISALYSAEIYRCDMAVLSSVLSSSYDVIYLSDI